jgi:hypothetical protein
MIFFFIQLIHYYYSLYLLMELFFLSDVSLDGRIQYIYIYIHSNSYFYIFSRQKDVLNAREKKMFMAFKNHLEKNVGVKQVNFIISLFAFSLLTCFYYFRKVFMNHFWLKLLIKTMTIIFYSDIYYYSIHYFFL